MRSSCTGIRGRKKGNYGPAVGASKKEREKKSSASREKEYNLLNSLHPPQRKKRLKPA